MKNDIEILILKSDLGAMRSALRAGGLEWSETPPASVLSRPDDRVFSFWATHREIFDLGQRFQLSRGGAGGDVPPLQ